MKNLFNLLITAFIVISCDQGNEVQPNEPKLEKPFFPEMQSENNSRGRYLFKSSYGEDFASNYYSYPGSWKGYLNKKVVWMDHPGHSFGTGDVAPSVPLYFDGATVWVGSQDGVVNDNDIYINTWNGRLSPGGLIAMNFEFYVTHPNYDPDGGEVQDLPPYVKYVTAGFWAINNNRAGGDLSVHIWVYYNDNWSYWKEVDCSDSENFDMNFPIAVTQGDRIAVAFQADPGNSEDILMPWFTLKN